MNLELNGDFDVVKTGSYFEIFGTVGINRGNYIIYGKKLSIKEGAITFQGGENIDPEINLRAELVFKGTDKVNHTLELLVSDNFMDPTITFTLDNSGISETDAMAILVFGKTSEELALAGQGSMVSSLGAGKLSQMITSQLTKTLGSTFNLDLIEVASTDNWQSASFVVGKYITNDLFVTYQRGFGETEGDEITPRKITLEYKLNRLLFLQLQSGTSKSSGLDIILKFEKKERDK
jgi:autotransporter translocation and assembly factor TamB